MRKLLKKFKKSEKQPEEENRSADAVAKQKKTKVGLLLHSLNSSKTLCLYLLQIIEKLNCTDCKKKFYDVAALEYHRIHQHAIEITPVRKFEQSPSKSSVKPVDER